MSRRAVDAARDDRVVSCDDDVDSRSLASDPSRASTSHAATTDFAVLLHPTAHFILVAAATIGSLALYGVLQERVMTIPYARERGESVALGRGDGGDGGALARALRGAFTRRGETSAAEDAPSKEDVFTCSMFLVFMNRWVALASSGALAMVTGWGGGATRGGAKDYAAVSFSNLVATVCQYEVLKYLTYSVSTLAKTMKVVPVMIWGQFLGEKKFTSREYVEATVMTFGCFVFVANRGWRSAVQKRYEGEYDESSLEWAANAGFLILAVYFVFDGFTSTFQQKMYRRDGVTVTAQVFFTSFFTTVFGFAWLVITDQLSPSIRFVHDHPAIVGDILLLSCASTVAQFSIAYTIKSYSAVILASIMTFRQFLSVLISCYVFSSPLNVVQWLGILLILAPLTFKHVAFANWAESAHPSSSKSDDDRLNAL